MGGGTGKILVPGGGKGKKHVQLEQITQKHIRSGRGETMEDGILI